jgi:hypothetical protein
MMKDMSEERLRALYAAHAANSPDTPHPDPDQMADAVLGRGSVENRLAVTDHAMTCTACRRELDLLQSAADSGRLLRARPVRTWVTLAAAAAIILAVGLTIRSGSLKDIRSSRVPDSERGGSVDGKGPNSITLVSPLGTLAHGETTHLVWRSVRGATSYTVEVVSDGGLVFRSESRDTVLAAPMLVGRRVYQWRVSATAPDGTVWRSPFTDFEVSP